MPSNLLLTNAGADLFVDESQDGTARVSIDRLVFGDGRYTHSAEQTAMQGNAVRTFTAADGLTTGGSSAGNVIHITVQDRTDAEYNVYEVGVFSGNVLVAIWSAGAGGDPLVVKAASSVVWQTVDIALAPGSAGTVEMGDITLDLNQATTEKRGTVELATAEETAAGTDAYRSITPATLKAETNKLVNLSGTQSITGAKTFTRTITGSISGNAATADHAAAADRASADAAGVSISGKYCRLDTAQDITGAKTFTQRPTVKRNGSSGLDIQDSGMSRTSAPSARRYNNMALLDKDGNRMLLAEHRQETSGAHGAGLWAFLPDGTSKNVFYGGLDAAGEPLSQAASTRTDRSGGTDIVTRDFIPKDTRIVHSTGAETIAGKKTFSSTIEGSISGNAATADRAASADTAVKLTTARNFQTDLGKTSAASFNGTAACEPGVKGILPKASGGTGNNEGLAAAATKLATARTFRTSLASTTAASFDGTANCTPGVTGILPKANGGTGNNEGLAAAATKLQTARKISLTGDVTGSTPSGGHFDGTAAVSIAATIGSAFARKKGIDGIGTYTADTTSGAYFMAIVIAENDNIVATDKYTVTATGGTIQASQVMGPQPGLYAVFGKATGSTLKLTFSNSGMSGLHGLLLYS